MIPPYLDSEELSPRMTVLPNQAFLVRPDTYTIIDGDTFRIRTPVLADGKRHEAFRIRLCSIDTPELRKNTLFDQVLRAGGFDPFHDGPGEAARDFLRALCRKRVILVTPDFDDHGRPRSDRYGRLLAQVCVSGAPGSLFRLDGARSIEHALFQAGLASTYPDRWLPACEPTILSRIREALDREAGPTMPC